MAGLKAALKQLRMWYLLRFRYKLLACGEGTYIARDVHIRDRAASIGRWSYLGPGCWIASNAAIGDYVMFGPRVAIVGGDHRINVAGTPAIFAGRDENKPVVVENDVWVGYGAIILHGVTLGEGSVVAAGAVVTKDVEPYSVVAGVPASPVRRRFSESEIHHHRAAMKLLDSRKSHGRGGRTPGSLSGES